MYSGTNQGLSSAWDRYVEHLRNFSEGAETLDSPEISSPLLPSTLDPLSGFVTQKFSSSSTSPAVIFSFDRYTVYELLLSRAVSLCRGFSISANPEVILARELAAASKSTKEPGKVKTIILAGASNLGSLKSIFQAHGANVIDLIKPGWMITEKNLESLTQELSALSNMEDTAVIFDIFGNSAFKFKHVDGTLILPFRVGGGGGYHFLGDISMDSDGKIGELISQAKPVFLCCERSPLHHYAPQPQVRLQRLLQGPLPLHESWLGELFGTDSGINFAFPQNLENSVGWVGGAGSILGHGHSVMSGFDSPYHAGKVGSSTACNWSGWRALH
jgi:hypothetical protein